MGKRRKNIGKASEKHKNSTQKHREKAQEVHNKMKDGHRGCKGTTQEKYRRNNGQVLQQQRKHIRTALKTQWTNIGTTPKHIGKAEEIHRQDIESSKDKMRKTTENQTGNIRKNIRNIINHRKNNGRT